MVIGRFGKIMNKNYDIKAKNWEQKFEIYSLLLFFKLSFFIFFIYPAGVFDFKKK
jgi:hypothetical protein